jgi:hypothetical protein
MYSEGMPSRGNLANVPFLSKDNLLGRVENKRAEIIAAARGLFVSLT